MQQRNLRGIRRASRPAVSERKVHGGNYLSRAQPSLFGGLVSRVHSRFAVTT